MEKYDTEIAKDIGLTERAQRRNKIINDDGTQHVDDMQAVRRKLEEDKAKEQEIRTELKELKNIELMTTGLELAKYLALEKSKHDLQIAQAVTRSRASADHDANIAQQALSQSGPFTGWQPVYQQPPYASFSGYPTSNKYPSEPSIYAPPQNALQTSSVAQQIPLNAELPAQHIPEAASVRQQPAAYTNSPAVESQFKPAQMPDIPNAALQPPSSSFQARPQYIPEVASAVQQSSSIVNKATAESQFSSNQIPGTSSAAQQTPSTNTELYPQYMAEVASFGQQPVSYVYNTAAESQFRPNKISETAAQSRHITKTVAIQRAPGPSRISRPFYNKNILSKRPKPWHKPIRLISNPSAKVKNQYGNANYLEGFPSKLTFPGPTYSPPPITVKVVKPTYIPVKTYAQYPTSYQSQTNLNIPQSFLNQGLVSFFSSQKQLQPYESWYKMSEMNTGKTYPSYQTQYLMLPFSQAAPQPTTIASLNAAPSSTFVEQHVNGYSPSASYLTNVPSSPVSQATKSGSSKHEIHSVKAIPPASTINEHEPSAIPDENAKATTYSNHPPSISTELPAASKAAVPSYTTYNNNKPLSAAQQPLPALIPKPITQYYGGPYQLHPVSSHEILDTDDSNFHGSSYNNNNNNNNNFNNGQQSAEQQHASNGGQQPASNGEQQTAPNGEQVPLAFGLFPLPEGKGQDMQSANESKGDKEGKIFQIFNNNLSEFFCIESSL